MELLNTHLTANPSPQESVGLLEVNERLHGLAGRLKERRPEDVAEALKLVEAYGSLVEENKSIADKEFDRIEKLFPGAEIGRIKLEIGGKTKEQLFKEMEKDIFLMENVEDIIKNKLFFVGTEKKAIDLVTIKVQDLTHGIVARGAIFEAAEKAGLKLCPMATGIYLRLRYKKSLGESRYIIGMLSRVGIFNADYIFSLFPDHNTSIKGMPLSGKFWLSHINLDLENQFRADDIMVFRLRDQASMTDVNPNLDMLKEKILIT